MRKQINKVLKVTGGIMLAGVMFAGAAAGYFVMADDDLAGASAASNDNEYTLEDMLTYAIEDEYLARTEYQVIMDEFGVQRPFSNIIKAEETHINELLPLLEAYNVSVPDKDWEGIVEVPDSLEEAYETGVTAEINNIAMYEAFLKEDIPDDVSEVFEELMSGSENHLAAFEKQVDKTGNGSGNNQAGMSGSGNHQEEAGISHESIGEGHGNKGASQGLGEDCDGSGEGLGEGNDQCDGSCEE